MANGSEIPRIRGILVFVAGALVGTVFTYFGILAFIGPIRPLTPFERCLMENGCDKVKRNTVDWVQCAAPCYAQQYEEFCAEAERQGRGDLCP